MSTGEREEISAADIARLAGVGRSAVANWRRRYADFPAPVGGSTASPKFDRSMVERWLRDTRKIDQLVVAGRTATGTERIAPPERSVSDLRPGELLGRVMAALLPRETASDLSSAASYLPSAAYVHFSAHGAEDTRDTDGREDGLVSGLRWSDFGDGGPGNVAPSVAEEVMRFRLDSWSRLIGRLDRPVVVDPACGDGTALLAVADRFGDRVKLAGQELRPGLAGTASVRLGADVGGLVYEVHVGDSLLDDQLAPYRGRASAVVCEPPFDAPGWPEAELSGDPRWEFGPPAPRDGELAWVQHAYAYLRPPVVRPGSSTSGAVWSGGAGLPGGVAVVAVSRRTCVAPSGEEIRTRLVRGGALRAVVELPPGMGTIDGTDLCLWILQQQRDTPDTGPVRMIDLSGLGDPADVPREYGAWRQLLGDAVSLRDRGPVADGAGDDLDPTVSRDVSRLDLVSSGVNLLPSQHVHGGAAAEAASAAELAATTERLTSLYERIGAGFPVFSASRRPSSPARVSVAELERSGAVTILPRDTPQHAGDVIVRTLGRPPAVAAAIVEKDESGFVRESVAEVDGAAQVIQVDASRYDPYFVAMFLRVDVAALPVANTLGAVSREDLRRCRIPRLPLSEQRRYGAEFKRLVELEAALRSLADLSGKVIGQAIYGLTAGTLAPGATIGDRAKTVGDGQ